MSTETLYNYLDYCETSCILHMVTRENIMGKELLRSQKKIYIADHGLREAVYGNNLRDINQTLEVDFVARKGADKLYVQVTYLLASEETME